MGSGEDLELVGCDGAGERPHVADLPAVAKGAYLHCTMHATEALVGFDDLCKAVGFDVARKLVHGDGEITVVVERPEGKTQPRCYLKIDCGQVRHLGTGGWNEPEDGSEG